MSSSSNAVNAAGLQPSESQKLSERQPDASESKILSSLRELYTCKPTASSYEVYAPDAVFHDPIGIAKGKGSIRAQFDGLAKIFPRADIPKLRVLENPSTVSSGTILVDQDVAYFRDAKASQPTKTINSLLTITRDPSSGLITSHTEEWNHNKVTTGEDGFLGQLNEWRKTATASLIDSVIGTKPKV